jgi:hypothetical protein
MTGSLEELLLTFLASKSVTNPAVLHMINDYAKYHWVLVILGGFSVLLFLVILRWLWKKFWVGPDLIGNIGNVGGRAYFFLMTFVGFVTASMSLIVYANLQNALHPKQGFRLAIHSLGVPASGSKTADIHQSFYTWIQSGDKTLPNYLTELIENRLSWQFPKAVISTLLLVVVLIATYMLWKTVVNSYLSFSRSKNFAIFASGVVLTLASTLLWVMAIANTQGSIAPLTLSLLFS